MTIHLIFSPVNRDGFGELSTDLCKRLAHKTFASRKVHKGSRTFILQSLWVTRPAVSVCSSAMLLAPHENTWKAGGRAAACGGSVSADGWNCLFATDFVEIWCPRMRMVRVLLACLVWAWPDEASPLVWITSFLRNILSPVCSHLWLRISASGGNYSAKPSNRCVKN